MGSRGFHKGASSSPLTPPDEGKCWHANFAMRAPFAHARPTARGRGVGNERPGADDADALEREVLVLRSRVAELQRRAARYEETSDVSLAEREELLREAERIAHLGTWTYDLGTGRVTWSDEMYRILGQDPNSFSPSVEAFYAAVHPDDRERAQAVHEQATRDGVLPLFDCRIVRPDGSIRHSTHLSSMLFDAQGTLRRMVGGVLDRTESLTVEGKLRRTLALLEEAQRFAQLGSWRFSPQTGETEWSLEFRRIAGIPEDIAPSVEHFLERVVPEDQADFLARYAETMAKPDGGHIDGRIRRPNGELRHIRLEGFSVLGADGHAELRGTMLDVTDQVRLREERAHAQKAEAVGRLAAGIAHDFNNLLTVVTGNLELLASRIGPTQELDDSHQALASAASLTGRLLAFGRKAPLDLRVLSPNALVHSTMALMTRLVGDEVRLETVLAPGLPDVRVDPLEIERALVNLVVNARDAMPGGGVVRLRSAVRQRADKVQVELSVEDQGPGVAEADRAHIFDPFYTTRSDSGGSGLGLATVLGTAEQHGGSVRVTDRPGGGSIFTIALPAAPSSQTRSPSPSQPVPGTEYDPKALELLVIDDEPMIAKLARRALENRGHRVHVATRPNEALAIWAKHGSVIDLVICDVAMSEMRGPELVQEMAATGVRPRVLFITGYSEEAVHSELKHPVLGKPFSSDALCAAIHRVLTE
jgi:two-component system, cell cycle sensor histidine kinase and response regulator CckA